MPLISIIVPVYDVAKYLDQCLYSLVHQTLHDIEIILVNDVSPDPQDHKICMEYKKQDDRIVYIQHTTNKGLGEARNTAIQQSKADYLLFVDSDDWIEKEMCSTLYKNIEETKSDIVVCGYKVVYDYGNKKDECHKLEPKTIHTKDIPDSEKIFFTALHFWDKLWKKSLFIDNNILISPHYYEDTATIPRLLYHTKKITMIPNVFYNYRQRIGSIMHQISERHFDDYIKTFDVLYNFLREKNTNQEFYKCFSQIILVCLASYDKVVFKSCNNDKEKNYYLTYALRHIKDTKYWVFFLDALSVEEKSYIFSTSYWKKRSNDFESMYNGLNENKWVVFARMKKKEKLVFIFKEVIRMFLRAKKAH